MRARRLIRQLAAAGILAACLAPPAHAQSAAVQKAALKIFQDYVTDGRIDPCRHTSQELKLAKDNIPPDIEQYAADYPAAIQAALEARARGECTGKKPATGLIVPPAATTPSPTPTPVATPVSTAVPTKTVVPDPPAPATATIAATATAAAPEDAALVRVAATHPSNPAPAPVLLLGILLAALAALAAAIVSMNRLGIAEERLAGVTHAWREARWRAGGTWEDFRDWLRLGR